MISGKQSKKKKNTICAYAIVPTQSPLFRLMSVAELLLPSMTTLENTVEHTHQNADF